MTPLAYHYRKITKAKEEPLISVASSTKKTIAMQKNTKPLEKEALKKKCLPGMP